MIKLHWCLYVIFLLSCSEIPAKDAEKTKIKVLFTSAIISGDEAYVEERKQDYIRNLQLLKSYGCDVYVVESCREGPTYLNEHCVQVNYTRSNDPNVSKSRNEVSSMRIGFSHFNFQPDDMIIKITGRYVLQTEEFIKLVKDNIDADVILRMWDSDDAYTGLFAVRGRVFLDFMDNHYLNLMDDPGFDESIEHELAKYVTRMKDKLKVVFWPKIYDYLPRCGPASG